MRPDKQEAFIRKVTPESYQSFKDDLDTWLGMTIQYRVCEMPIFVSREFRLMMEDAAKQIIIQSSSPEARERTEPTLQDRYRVPHEAERPLFSVVDFAVTQDDEGGFRPQLIELQGFPSLLGYQYILARNYRERYDLEGSEFMGGLNGENYLSLLRKAIYADEDPAHCVLLEVDPENQKTLSDFRALERFIGLRTVDIRHVTKRGRSLFATIDGRETQLKRIFNRAIIDELDDMGVDIPFAWYDDLDVEWAGHPNWYFRISKFSMPFIDHWSVPTTQFLDTVTDVPQDLSRYVLKPLYSFAGKGVNVNPTVADLDAVPSGERQNWILQQKVTYAPCIATPYGQNKVEIRVMLIWLPEEDTPQCVMSLARTGRGDLMGARYNMDPWTGSSGCLFD